MWSLEAGLSRLEGKAALIVKKLVKERNVKRLDEDEVTALAVFLAVQLVRTKEHRLKFEHIRQLSAERLKAEGASEENIEELLGNPIEAHEEKLHGLLAFLQVKEFAPHFLNKVWVLCQTTRKGPFFISDNPITLHNDTNYGLYGNLGLAVKRIQIYMPISSTLCLWLLCPTLAEEWRKEYENIRLPDEVTPSLADSMEALRAIHERVENGTPIKVTKDTVMLINSLQVAYSSRFVYCEIDNFDLVEKMINDNPECREGLKMIMM